ncbi:MAG: alanine--tRNA ligase [Candidatus Njordarchaeota archaeon]
MKGRPQEYETTFFKEKGFIRKKCPVCGEYFWTLNPNKKTCGDVECENEYGFIKSIEPTSEWDIHNTIKRWETFFSERGHTILDYYPVVARWREDIYFTIASIAIFQPWVTDGIVDPPANPLVVAQPCIRFGGEFSDIDRIGRTGRHLSSFTMGGQHAFNSPKWRCGYWKDRYLELNFEFLTKVMRIPAEDLTYKEDWWKGGGNAGPSIETFAYGLEIVNGVFMQYKIVNGSLKPLPIRVLDVGWGLERVSWFMQGTPTIYEATFGPLFKWLRDMTSVDVDSDLLLTYGRHVGAIRTETEDLFQNSRKTLAKKLGLSLSEFNKIFGPIESLYAILDHVKTVVMAIPDGGIPANIGGAYNLRAILRRAISLSEKHNLRIDWDELISRTIDYFSRTFHRLATIKHVAPEIWHLESKKFKETIEKAIRELKRLIKKKKIAIIDDAILQRFYLNYGVPPEEIDSIVRRFDLGATVKISPNFYEKIKNRAPTEEKSREKPSPIFPYESEISNLEPTRLLYYEDPYLKTFKGKIIFAKDRYIILDQTAFYPRGGGQLPDTGEIFLENNDTLQILDVFKIGDIVIHVTSKPINSKLNGKIVQGRINWDRRLALMRHHSATHIINGAAQKILGPHVWQMGAEKKPEKAHLDISHYKNLTDEEIRKIEQLANKIVLENRPIHLKFMKRTEAEKKYGVRIYQGGAVPAAVLRIVEIENWDVEACGGTHLTQTILVGPIKIINTRKIHDGVVRIEFVAGERAIDYIHQNEYYLKKSCDILRVQPQNLPRVVERFFIEWKRQKDELSKLWKFMVNNLGRFVSDKVLEKNGKRYLLMRIDVDIKMLFEALKRVKEKADNILIVSTSLAENLFICSGDTEFLNIIKKQVTELGGEFRETKNIIFGSLNIPSDNLLIRIKKILSLNLH